MAPYRPRNERQLLKLTDPPDWFPNPPPMASGLVTLTWSPPALENTMLLQSSLILFIYALPSASPLFHKDMEFILQSPISIFLFEEDVPRPSCFPPNKGSQSLPLLYQGCCHIFKHNASTSWHNRPLACGVRWKQYLLLHRLFASPQLQECLSNVNVLNDIWIGAKNRRIKLYFHHNFFFFVLPPLTNCFPHNRNYFINLNSFQLI